MDIIKSLPLLISAALAAAPTLPAPPQAPLGVTSDSNAFLASAGRNALNDVISASPLLSFHRDLVSIESISGSEGRAGSFVADFLESQNFTVIKQPVTTADWDEDRFNIFAFPSSHPHSNPLDEDHPGQGPEILLTSHIDTVPPFIPYSLHRDDDGDIRIAGRGTVDAKASVAAQIFAALDTLRDHPTAPLGLLFVVGEETGGDGMKAFSRSRLNPAPSAFHTIIFGEPTDLALVAGHKGMLGFEVVAHGHPAHSGYPWLGASAISAILPALARVDVLGDIPGGLPASEKYGRTTLNIGRIEGGVAANVVPAFARADVAARLAAGSPDDARDIIRRAVRETTVRGDATVEVDFSRHLEAYPPQDLDVDVPGFNVSTVNYGTDVPNLEIHARADGPVKRYLYGPGSIHVAHGDREALTVRQLEDAVCGYKRLIRAALDRTRS